jgi:TetR/AcrR family transcriptional repressor of nem operon
MQRRNVREDILDAGLKALLYQGFNGVGVQEITASAGVPKGSFYNHFESKEALGVEIVERYADGVGATRRAILHDKSVAPLERLRCYFANTNTMFIEANFERGCLLGNFSAELSNQSAAIREALRKVYGRWTADIAVAIADAQADGTIASKTPAGELAAYLLDAYEGALLRSRVERSREAFDRFVEFAFTRILV